MSFICFLGRMGGGKIEGECLMVKREDSLQFARWRESLKNVQALVCLGRKSTLLLIVIKKRESCAISDDISSLKKRGIFFHFSNDKWRFSLFFYPVYIFNSLIIDSLFISFTKKLLFVIFISSFYFLLLAIVECSRCK